MAANSEITQPKSKTNITLESTIIDEVKDYIKKKIDENQTYPFRTPTALIREAIRSYIFPNESAESVSNFQFEELQKRVKAIEKTRTDIANEEQRVYIRCVAMLINIFDKNLDFFESFKIAQRVLEESTFSPVEFREFSRIDIENFFLDNLGNPPDELQKVVQSHPLFPLLMMFLFLCNLGFTRRQDVIDPMAPMSIRFLETVKKMIEVKRP